jgi:hypothetical protein
VDEPDPARLLRTEPLGGEEVAAGLAGADGADHERRDHGRHDAEPHLAGRELRRLPGDRDVAGGDQAEPAADGRALDHHHDGLRAVVDRAQHQLERARVGAVLPLVVAGGALHPVQVGPGREALAGTRQHDRPHRLVLAQILEGLRQSGDQRLVERVVELRPVERHPRDRAVAAHEDDGILAHARLTSGTRRSASPGSAR